MTHPEILLTERLGSRAQGLSCRCTFCDCVIEEEEVYINLFGRSFCGKKCKEAYYGRNKKDDLF